MTPRPYRGVLPTLGARTYIDPAATLIGDVVLGDDVSLWPGVVVRGDVNFIRVGARTNIQDGTVVHVSHDGPHAKLGGFATVIGEDVTIGHKAVVHACRIGDAEQLRSLYVLDVDLVQQPVADGRFAGAGIAGNLGRGRAGLEVDSRFQPLAEC